MKKLIDEIYKFDRRPTYAIFGIENDFGFGCMDKVAIALDLGFTAEQSGVVTNVVPHHFGSIEEVEQFPWNISLDGKCAQAELKNMKNWLKHKTIHQGGGCFGPLTVAACIVGVEECTRMVRKKPEVLHAIMRRVTDFMILLAKEEERMGADSFWIAEPVASLLSPKNCLEFCSSYIKEIYSSVEIPGVLHVCGNTDHLTLELLETGAQALSIDWCTNLPECLALVPNDVVIMGNVSPMLLWRGTQDEIRKQTELLLEQTRNYKNFVLATGCQVPGMAPKENVQLMIDIGRQYSIWNNEEYRSIEKLAALYCSDGKVAFEAHCREMNVSHPILTAAEDVAVKHLSVREKYHRSFTGRR